MASCRNSTPSMRGMRWSARSKATLSLRSFNCFKRSSAPSGESLPMTRYEAPYCERRSRSIARNTSESSSTLSKIGLAMLDLSSRQRDDYTLLRSLVELVRYRKLHLVAQFLLWGIGRRVATTTRKGAVRDKVATFKKQARCLTKSSAPGLPRATRKSGVEVS